MEPARTHVKKNTRPRALAGVTRSNSLLAALPGAERRELVAKCERVELAFGEVVAEPGARIRYAYFPTASFVALISSIDQRLRSQLEVSMVGTEGMLGIPLLLGVNVEPLYGVVQGAGSALRMEAAQFSSELEKSVALRQVLNRYLYVLMSQLAQMPACTRFHVLEARFARWLLTTRDRANSNEFHVTHERIAHMLGVRRVGITHAAGDLQKRELISYHRGKLTILDQAGLEAVSCTCYAAANGAYAALIHVNGRSRGGARDMRRGAVTSDT
jgi:CRP-like cAMP-binding protein